MQHIHWEAMRKLGAILSFKDYDKGGWLELENSKMKEIDSLILFQRAGIQEYGIIQLHAR